MASRNTGSGTFFSNPEMVLEVEAGKEYYLELTTRFSAKLNVHSAEMGLKKLRDARLLLPYGKYECEYQKMTEVYSDPVVYQVRHRFSKDSEILSLKLNDDPTEQGTYINVSKSFRGGALRILERPGTIKVVIEQYGYAINCSDQGIFLNEQ